MFNNLLSNDIRQTLDHFRRSVDQLFETTYAPGRLNGEMVRNEWAFSPLVETAWTENELLLRAIVPGVAEQDLRVQVQGNQLVIEGERRQPPSFEKNAWTQLSYGNFHTALNLPNNLSLDKVSCRLQNGILDIHVPIAEEMKPREIRINSSEERKTISA